MNLHVCRERWTNDERCMRLTIDDICVDLLLDDGVSLDHSSHVWCAGLRDVLLYMMYDVFVDFTMEDGLNLSDLVVSHCLLDDGSTN